MQLRNNILWIGCLTAAAQACALTLGAPHGPVVLGAPLDIRITVTPDPDQTLASSCIEAHALFGETPAKIRTDLQPPHTVRLRSLQAINEPLATLHLSAGCTGKVSRSYTLFADPPEIAPPAPALPASASAPRPGASATAGTASATPPAPRRSPPKTTTAKRPAAQKKPAPPPPAPPAAVPIPSTAAEASAATAAAPADTTLQAEATTARPVLRMDTLFLFHDPAEATAARPDTTIALAPTPAAEVADERLQALEKQLSSLQQQQKKDRAQILALTSQLALTAAADTIPLWLYLLLAALVASLLAIAYLLHRLRVERTQVQDGWMQAVRSAQPAPAASNAPAAAPATRSVQAPVPSPAPVTTAAEVAAPPEPVPSQEAPETAPLVKPNSFLLPQADNFLEDEQEGPPSAYFTVTSQDFLDTQEQAEFYASIGEYDEAIGLLQTHIANDNNSSPLPYLKLLDFFYQLSRTDAFEQTRQDLEAAFNIHAPSLAQYHAQGPGLLEGYPTLLTHIEALWPSDEVLALLRGAIHYPTKTPALPEPLPRLAPTAFHELLLLYGIAQATPAATRGSLTGRTSTIAAAQNSAALTAPAAAPLLDLPHFDASQDAGLPELPEHLELPALPQTQSPELPPLAEETAAPPAAPLATADDALLTDFGLDWPLSTDAAESAAPTPPAEEAPALPFDLDGLDFDNFEFKPTAPPDTKA